MLARRRAGNAYRRRWILHRLDEDWLQAALLTASWSREEERGIEEDVKWLRDTIKDVCNVAMPCPRQAAY